jgi:hypothetical protein
MNNNFCKVFQINENHQVIYHLVVVENEDTGENETGIEMKTFIKGSQLKATMSGFQGDVTPEEHLKTVTIENANNFFNKMNNFLK